MKKLLLFMFAALAFAACEQAPIEEQSAIRQDTPETITVGFEGDDTRIQLNKAQKTVWNSGDEVSVFYRSNGNQKWQYKGEDGVRQATLSRVQNATGSTSITKTVVVYPYDETYWLNTDSYCIEATTPATQHYAVDSYGVGDNLMVSQGEFTQFSLKNVYGWLKLQLTGDGETIKSIKFRGNNGEQVAGLIYVDTATAEATLAAEMGDAEDNNAGGNLVFEDTILTEVTLDCGEGVTLGAEATAFYIALPPQTLEQGFNIEIVCADGSKMVKSSDKALSIERNHIQPMAELLYTANISPSNQIWYTSSNGNIVNPYDTDVFAANIISNTYNNGKGVIKFDGPLTKIGKFAFYSCGSLTSVTIPDSVTEIGNFAFHNCGNLTNVTIPDSVIEIGDSAFYDCQKLINIIFSENITTIGEAAFGNCKSFTCITIPDNVTSIGDGVFRACSNLTEFKGKFSEDNGRILVVDGRLVALAPAGLTEYTIPDSVTTIGYSVFWNSSYLTSITIPDSVTTIGENAFQHCSALVNINIPNGVTAIGDDTFYNCIKLPKITIPESVSVIGNQAFYNCSKLEEVTIPDSVTTIGYGAFHSCDNLTKFSGKFAEDGGRILVVDGSLVAFAPAGLTEYSIPDYVTSISGYTFRECHNLTQVTIPYNTSIIGSLAFHDCSSLTSIYIKALTPPVLDYSPFNANASNRKIYVPSESVDAYKSAASWSEYADAIVGYDF